MTHPQQPELHRNDKGQTTQDGRAANAADEDVPATGGNPAPTPDANVTEDERHSGSTSTTVDALRKD
jgi:hypothetical protein